MTANVAFLTYDFEVKETSLVQQRLSEASVREEMLTPLLAQLSWAERAQARSTVFVEICQLAAFRRIWPALVREMTVALQEAVARGSVELQLHVHPNWDPQNGARVSATEVQFGPQSYRYATGREPEIAGEWMQQFALLFGATPTAFRSGKYRPIPDALRQALIDGGVRVFSSSVQGATIVADDGTVIDFRDVSESLAAATGTVGAVQIVDVPVTARSGQTLTPDFMSARVFEQAVRELAARRTSLCVVSHQKDIQGESFAIHVQNIETLKRHGFELERLTLAAAVEVAANKAASAVVFSSDSAHLMTQLSRHGRLRRRTTTTFPRWVLDAMIAWQDEAGRDIGGEEIEELVTRRGLLPRRVSVHAAGARVTIVVGPSTARLVRRLKYIARRIVFVMPAGLSNRLRRLRQERAPAYALDLDLLRHVRARRSE